MVLLDDVVVALGAGATSTSLIILSALLSKYQRTVEDARKSNELAKNLFDALSARLAVQDSRIVDLMAKLEVYSARKSLPARSATSGFVSSTSVAQTPVPSITTSRSALRPISQVVGVSTAPVQSIKASNATELTILRALSEGAKTSNSIRDVIQVTREHNARLLKGLYQRGLVSRSDEHKPYLYQITEAGKVYLTSSLSST